jgi:hypothetical protein
MLAKACFRSSGLGIARARSVERLERLHRQAEVACRALRLERSGDATDVEPPSRECRQEPGHGGARAEADRHPRFDELGRSLGREALFVVVAHGSTVSP